MKRVVVHMISAMLALPVICAASGNLLQNPGFETGPAQGGTPEEWWKYEAAGQEFWAARSGTNGMAWHAWTENTYGGFGQDVSVALTNGNVFSFSIWGRAEEHFASSQSEGWIMVEFWHGGDGAYLYRITNNIYSTLYSNKGSWTKYTLTWTNTNPNVNLVKALVGYGWAAPEATQDVHAAVFWDDAELVQKPVPPGTVILISQLGIHLLLGVGLIAPLLGFCVSANARS